MFFKKWREEKRKRKEEAATFKRILDEYVEKELISENKSSAGSAENLCIVFGYKNTANLVKHSKHLTWLTIALLIVIVVLLI